MSRDNKQKKFRKIPGGQKVCTNVVVCPHCKRSGQAYAFARHHFSNCKERKDGLLQSLKRELLNDMSEDEMTSILKEMR